MKVAGSMLVAGILVFLVSVAPVLADSVETWDGRLFEGKVIAGIPDVINLDDNGVSVSVRREATLRVAFNEGSETVQVTTITGQVFQDQLLPSLGTITIRTDSGETEISPGQIRKIAFPYAQSENPIYPNTVYMTDGRTYKGKLTADFPEKISIDVTGITSSVFTDTITSLKFGAPSTIETTERMYQGTIISNLPQAIKLETKFGGLSINRTDVASIAFSPRRAVPGGGTGFGLGAKFIGSVPLLSVMARWNSIGIEGAAGVNNGVVVFEGYGRFSISLLDNTLSSYIGGGFLGVTANGIAVSGLEVLGGIEFSFYQAIGIPISAFAGANWLIGGGQFWHFGLRWNF